VGVWTEVVEPMALGGTHGCFRDQFADQRVTGSRSDSDGGSTCFSLNRPEHRTFQFQVFGFLSE
jgi:hypothetical protein